MVKCLCFDQDGCTYGLSLSLGQGCEAIYGSLKSCKMGFIHVSVCVCARVCKCMSITSWRLQNNEGTRPPFGDTY